MLLRNERFWSLFIERVCFAFEVSRGVLHHKMQTCMTGEVRGSKRKGFERSFLGVPHFAGVSKMWGSQNPKGQVLGAREGRALSCHVRTNPQPLSFNYRKTIGIY